MTLHKLALILATIMLLPACSNRSEEAQEILKSHMVDNAYLEFQNLETFPGGAVCGEFRRNDPMSGTTRYRRFIVWGDSAKTRPSKQDWAIFCDEDAATALRTQFGIGPVAEEENHLPQIRNDLRRLQLALEQYREDNHTIPTLEQGLSALVSATTTPPVPMEFRAGGYIDTAPADPWGRPYIYEISTLGGRVVKQFEIYTLGADGVRGGEGKNADVALEHLKYLDHINPS
jgi:general secretion pathway protein G